MHKLLMIWSGVIALAGGSLARADDPPAATPPKPTPPKPTFVQLRRALPHVLVHGSVRVFYATTGEHAVREDDLNENAIPDQVEDVATQAVAALRLWTSLGFLHPLESPRYRGVRWIDIHLLQRQTLKANGLAYDEIQSFRREIDPPGTRSLAFDVATSVVPSANRTPAHEMFHVIQNGSTYFKNRWYTEGTARWSESGLGMKTGATEKQPVDWPPSAEGLAEVYASTYDTATTYWGPLFQQESRLREIPRDRIPDDVLSARYANGKAVLEDFELVGWDLVRDILAALGEADDQVQADRQLDGWPEAEQKSDLNNPVIHRVVEEVVQRSREADAGSDRLDEKE